MLSISQSKKELEKIHSKIIENSFSIEKLVLDIADFYYKNPIKKFSKEDDGDMLLFEYGSFDFGKGENFQISFTRQFYSPRKIQQLHLILYFDHKLNSLFSLSENFWNYSVTNQKEWEQKVVNTKGIQLIKNHSPKKIEIELETV